MKKIENYLGYISFICLIIIDLLIFLIPSNKSYTVQFWTGFVFVQTPFLGYSFIKICFKELFINNTIECIFLVYVIAMILNGLVAFLTPYLEKTFIALLLGNIFITLIVSLMVAFELFKIVKNNKMK